MGNTTSQPESIVKLIFYWIIPTATATALSGFILASTLVGFFPRTFGPIFGSFLNYQEDGIYADCSLHQNRSNGICSRAREVHEDRNWNSLKRSKKASPFSLHGG